MIVDALRNAVEDMEENNRLRHIWSESRCLWRHNESVVTLINSHDVVKETAQTQMTIKVFHTRKISSFLDDQKRGAYLQSMRNFHKCVECECVPPLNTLKILS